MGGPHDRINGHLKTPKVCDLMTRVEEREMHRQQSIFLLVFDVMGALETRTVV